MALIKRGTIYWVQLDPVVGSEIRKTRPAVVVSNDQNNQVSPLITVVPITSNVTLFGPFEVTLASGDGGLQKPGKAKANQIRTIDKRRLSSQALGDTLRIDLMQQIDQAIKIHLAL